MTGSEGKVVLHVQDGDYKYASRVFKQARSALRSGFAARVELLGLSSPGMPALEERDLGLRIHRIVVAPEVRRLGAMPTIWRLCLRWLRFYEAGKRLPCDVVHCHSFSALVPSVALARYHRVPVVYDAHELESQAGQPPARAALALLIEWLLIHRAAAVLCVSGAIADWYAKKFTLVRPFVVRNIPDLQSQITVEGPNPLRTRLSVRDEDFVFLYQGALSSGRRVEQLLRVFAVAPPDRHIVFMGYGSLQSVVEEAALRHSNIHFFSAVPPEQVLAHSRGADVGICGVENVCLSYFYSLPNKLFEYLHAGLPILVPEWPEMLNIVKAYDCGWVVGESDSDWLSAVSNLTKEEIGRRAVGSRRAAASFSWESEAKTLLAAYEAAVTRPSGRY